MSARPDLADRRFGRLVVIRRAASRRRRNGNSQRFWLCRCDCGAEVEAKTSDLMRGATVSCGCFRRELTAPGHKAHNLTHGLSLCDGRRSPTYSTWMAMRQRCYNPRHRKYKFYGGRGITVCDRWLNSFENFLADMGERPSDKTLHRIDHDRHYEPGNCEWRTPPH